LRTYEKTHPWLTFSIDLRKAGPNLWMLLGEAQSKCEHIAGVPLRPSTAERLHQIYLAKGIAATTAIEGNTLSEEEVLARIEGKKTLPPSKEYLGQEVDNILKACSLIGESLFKGESTELSVQSIRNYNHMVLENLSLEEGVVPGEIRKHAVGVGRYRGAPAEDCEYLMETLFSWLNGETFRSPGGSTIAYGLIKAITAHLYLAWIHPFGDGNGRTARLVEFQILLAAGVPSAAAHLLSNHYNETRQEYYRQLEKSSQSGSEVLPFIEYALQGFVDGLKEQIEAIREQQWDIAWENYVHEVFVGKTSEKDDRRKYLVLDLTSARKPVPMEKLREVSPRIAAAYAKKTKKTFTRDLNALSKMNLIKPTAEGVIANRGIILAFLPPRRAAESS
jgi:Fic family protein